MNIASQCSYLGKEVFVSHLPWPSNFVIMSCMICTYMWIFCSIKIILEMEQISIYIGSQKCETFWGTKQNLNFNQPNKIWILTLYDTQFQYFYIWYLGLLTRTLTSLRDILQNPWEGVIGWKLHNTHGSLATGYQNKLESKSHICILSI